MSNSAAHVKQSDILFNKFKSFLLNNDFVEGDRIPSERELAIHMECSRNSLREVIKILQTMDILEAKRGSGIYIKSLVAIKDGSMSKWISLNKSRILDLHNVRTALELKALELIPVTELPNVANTLHKCVDRLNIKECNNNDFIMHDREFHNVIREASGNTILCEICRDISDTVLDERIAIAQDQHRKEISYAEHLTIIQALMTCDVGFIKQVCTAHYNSVNKYILGM